MGPVKVEARGALITYLVEIGPMVVRVKLLNVEKRAPANSRLLLNTNSTSATSIFLGVTSDNKEIVTKRFNFSDNTYALRTKEDGMKWEVWGCYE